MGQTLSEPVTEKHTESGADGRYIYAVSEMQGWRIGMEDAHTTVLHLEEGKDNNSFFAVFDGHGGSAVAKYAGQNVHKRLISEDAYKEKDYNLALRKAFMGTDDDLRADRAFSYDPSGCTAVAALLANEKIYVANAGDSRSVLCLKGDAKPLSFDHKPQNQTESSRIMAAGGYIEYGRVNGNLALSRAIGDFEFKQNYSLGPEQQIVTSNPDVTEHEITEDDEFLVLACDGIWDCLSSRQVINVVRRQIAQKKELSEICEGLMDRCLAPDSDSGAGIGCDNMTIMVIGILHGRTKEEWYDWIADRVERNYGTETPVELPQIYSASRIAAAAERAQYRQNGGVNIRGPGGGLGALARVLGGSGLTFHPGGGLGNQPGGVTFDDSDDDMPSDDDEDGGIFNNADSNSRDVTKSLRAQLNELEDEDVDMEDSEPEDPRSKANHEDPQLSTITSLEPTSVGKPHIASPEVLQNFSPLRSPSPSTQIDLNKANGVLEEANAPTSKLQDEASPKEAVEVPKKA